MAEISFTFTVSSTNKTRIIDGIAGQHNYQATIEDAEGKSIPNPETKGVFVKRMAREWVISNVRSFEANQAAEDSRKAAIDDVDTNVTVT